MQCINITYRRRWYLGEVNVSLAFALDFMADFHSLSPIHPEVRVLPLRVSELVLEPARPRVQLLEDGWQVLLAEHGVQHGLQQHDGEPLVEDGVLQHVEERHEAGARRVGPDDALQVVAQAREHGHLGRKEFSGVERFMDLTTCQLIAGLAACFW